MLDVRLRMVAPGQLRFATKADLEAVADYFQPNELIRARLSRTRSQKQNAYFHAMIETAYDNLPDGSQWQDWRHLKAWLLIQIGHCEEHRFKRGSLTPEVAKLLRAKVDTVETTVHRKTGEIVMRFAKQTRDLTDEQMSPLIDKVLHVIETRVLPGLDVEGLARSRAA